MDRFRARISQIVVITIIVITVVLATTSLRWALPPVHAQAVRSRLYLDHEIRVETYYRGGTLLHATPLSLASEDFDVDGINDLAVGFATPTGGMIAMHRGNLDAFAPQSEASFQAVGRGEYPSPYLPEAQLVKIPTRPDFLVGGDFIGQNGPGVVAAARGGSILHVLARGASGQIELLQSITVAGAITALDSHPLIPGKYAQLTIGIHTSTGAQLAIYSGSHEGLKLDSIYQLASDATGFAFGNLDSDSRTDVLVLAGGKVSILHSASHTLEPVPLSYAVTAATVGRFLFDRTAMHQMALLGDDGSLHVVAQEGIDSRPLTAEDFVGRRHRDALRPNSSVAPPIEHDVRWKEVERFSRVSPTGSGQAARLFRTRISNNSADDVILFGGTEATMVTHPDQNPAAGTVEAVGLGETVAALPLRVNVAGGHGLVYLKNGDVQPHVNVQAVAATLFVNKTTDPTPTAPITNACKNTSSADTSSSCSLREAVLRANADNANDTIMVAAGTYTLTLPKIYHDFTGNHGTLEVKASVNIVGAGAATTIIQAGTSNPATCIAAYPPPSPLPLLTNANYEVYTPYPNTSACNSVDKIFSFNQDVGPFCSTGNVPTNTPLTSSGSAAPALPFTVAAACAGADLTNATVTLSGVTLQNGFNRGNVVGDDDGYGGAFDFDTGTSGNATLTITSCIIQNNLGAQGAGMTLFNFTHPSVNTSLADPTVIISNTTIQNNVAASLDPYFDMHEMGEVGIAGALAADIDTRVKMTASQVLNNTATQIAASRSGTNTINWSAGSSGGLLFLGQAASTINAVHSSTISGNSGLGLGGGVQNTASLVIDTGSVISGNQAVEQGAGLLSNGGTNSTTHVSDTVTISNVTFLNNTLVACTTLSTSSLCTSLNSFSPITVVGGGAIMQGNLSGAPPITLQFNRFVGNSAGTGTGANIWNGATNITATDNWWGTNTSAAIAGTISNNNGNGSCASGCTAVTTFTPFIELAFTPSPTTINVGGTSTMTASFVKDSAGNTLTSANLAVMQGLPITFNSAVNGSLSSAQTTIQSAGTATATFTGTTVGSGTADAVIDGFTLISSPIVAVNSPTSTAAVNQTATYHDASQNVTLSANITATCCTVAGGTVAFKVFNGATQIGITTTSGTVAAGTASATFSLPGGTTAGTYTIQAVYSGTSTGTGDFLTSSDLTNTHTLIVNPAPTTTTASSTTAPFSASSQTVPLSATVTSADGTVNSGTVTFTIFNSSNAQVGSPVTSGTVASGAASANFTLPASSPIGVYSIHATYNASTNFATGSDNTHTLTVNAPTTTAASNATATFNSVSQTVPLSATVTSTAGVVSVGTVTFSVFNSSSVQVGSSVTSATVSSGNASANFTLPAGAGAATYAIHATYNASGAFLTSSDTTHTLTVGAASTTTTASNATASFSAGSQSVTLNATVTSAAGTVGAGTVTFTIFNSSNAQVGSPVTSGTVASGAASANFTLPASSPAGVYSIHATYNASTNFATSSDNAHTLSVNATTTTAASNASATFNSNDQSVTLSATVTSAGGPVAVGTVTFTVFNSSSVQVGSPVTSGTVSGGNASASYTLPSGSAAGTYSIHATYNAGGNFSTSSDNTHNLTVTAAPTTTTASNATANFSASSQSVPLNATVTSTAGTVGAGTVTFTIFDSSNAQVGSPVTSGAVAAGGASANFTLPASSPAGTYSIHATYNASPNFATSSDNTHTLTVNTTTSSTTTTASGASATFSPGAQLITLSATVTSSSTVNTGTMTFKVFSGPTQIGATVGPISVSGGSASAGYTLPGNTPAGIYTIQASYTGAGSFTSSSDNSHALVVGKATPVITWSNPASIVFGSALSAQQLNAAANVAGTFVYTPPVGTVLSVGIGQTLSVQFTPTDGIDYNTASQTVQISVTAASSPATLVLTSTLARDQSTNNVIVTLTIANTGGSSATNVQVNASAISGTATITPVPVAVADVPAGGSSTVTLTFPASVGSAGARAVLSLAGTYSGGSFGGSSRITLP